MTASRSRRPLLLLDVDGPLNPFGRQPGPCAERYASHMLRPRNWVERHGGVIEEAPALRVDLNPAHGPALTALGCELVWATTWMDQANAMIGPVLGLPRLPFIDWGDALFSPDPAGLHWKTRAVVAYAAGRPFAWIDDEIEASDRDWVAAECGPSVLLHAVSDEVGLTDDDFTVIQAWVQEF
ncbi:hypothetical protein [Yinghuangia soli]|uniref:Secreted protein n=1 Tax=Yinghuangia soli TaxID=2908204 RepID=A0AA41U0Z3_9ACTN|nr:hypothetical protein [Yinghuangia soli]MCF2528990.1 hypothetical protein [Yinghuangia soli]